MSFWPDLLAWDWTSVGKTVFGAGLGSGIVNLLWTSNHERRERNARAASLAMRLAIVFEGYTTSCIDQISYNYNQETPPGEEFPRWQITLPKIGDFPDDAEGWRALERNLAARCRGFQNQIDDNQRTISGVAEYAIDDLKDTLDECIARLGLAAWTLAASLRSQHKVDALKPSWDWKTSLEDTLAEARKSLTRAKADNAGLMSKVVKHPQPPHESHRVPE